MLRLSLTLTSLAAPCGLFLSGLMPLWATAGAAAGLLGLSAILRRSVDPVELDADRLSAIDNLVEGYVDGLADAYPRELADEDDDERAGDAVRA
jgi:hypothetical protein